MSSFIVPEAIRSAVTAGSKEDVIRELVRALHDAGQFPNTELDDVVKAVLRREELGSTGIGRGIAIPHSRHPSVGQLVGTLGLSKTGVDFKSIDGEPVDVFILLISPQDRPGDHLRALENVVQAMKDDVFVQSLRSCETQAQIWELIGGTRPAW